MKRKDFYTVKEFAKEVHYSERQVRRLISQGKIPATKIGRKLLIPAVQVFQGAINPEVYEETLRANIRDLRHELGLPFIYTPPGGGLEF